MNKWYKIAVMLWGTFVVMLGVSFVLAVLKNQGRLIGINPFFFLIGPVAYFVGVAALITTAKGTAQAAVQATINNRSFLWLFTALLNSFAFWLGVMGVVFAVGLVYGTPQFVWPRIIAATGALIIFMIGWRRVEKYKLLGLLPTGGYLFQIVRNLFLL